MHIKLKMGASVLALGLLVGCGADNSTATNSNAGTSAEVTTETTEYTASTVTGGGVTTETRTYKSNPRISKIVITTRDGKKTARVVSVSGEERELKDDVDAVLRKSGEEIASAAGFVADKAEDVGGKAADVGKTVGKEVADKGEDVAGKASDGAKKVGDKTVEGAKTVGNKAVQGAKKTGSAIKDAVTP